MASLTFIRASHSVDKTQIRTTFLYYLWVFLYYLWKGNVFEGREEQILAPDKKIVFFYTLLYCTMLTTLNIEYTQDDWFNGHK